uniref:Vitellogenin domain-containing protein n=1 Tax=Anopheles culicifacies TaxID=139723 RepID=A0A182M2K1_9DIPT
MERRKSAVYGFILFFALIITVDAYKRNPLKDPRICGRPVCSDANNKFRYNVGSLYKYDHSMYVKTALVGSGDNISELHISSVVEVDYYAPCQGILRLYSIEVREQPVQETEETDFEYGEEPTSADNHESDQDETSGVHPKSEVIAEELTRFELRFAFHDGTISEICHENDEPVWTLNFKRGILSALQNTMPRFDIDFETTETDVSGICDVQYKTNGRNGTRLLFRKTKDIMSCKQRYKTISFIQTVAYNFRSISIDNSIYKSVACYERHQLEPFSHGMTGAVTETSNKLELVDEEIYTRDGHSHEEIDIQHRSSLLYDHTPSIRDSHNENKAARELLIELCAYGFPNIKREFPDVFLKFLTAARYLSDTALGELVKRSKSICENGRNHLLESLPYIDTAASVKVMKDQIVEGLVNHMLADKWMGSFAYLTRPNEEVLEVMKELIDYGKASGNQTYLLSATAVVHTFCKIHSDCAEAEVVQAIVQELEQELLETLQAAGTDLGHNRRKHERVIVLLMSLSNMGVVNEPFNYELRKIIEDELYPTAVRVEAVNVFRRSDCTRTKDYFLKLYSSFEQNVEVRIAAYLQAMRCPDYLSVKLIKHVLKTEEVNQVGTFVWSHLTNLAKSASPVRVATQGLLAENGENLGKKFRRDVRSFSRNYEQTLFFDEYNFGLTVDSNVIFSTESYLPRSVRLNLTTDLFGESINFLELNVRLEGLEDSVHKFFGPNGTYSAKVVNEQLMGYMKYLRQYIPAQILELFEDDMVMGDEEEDFEEGGRRKRAVAKRLPALIARKVQDEVDKLGYHLKSNFNNPLFTIGVKIFGNELSYYTDGLELFSISNQRKMLKDLFSGKERAYTKSSVFLDTSYNVPLSSGLPLALGLVGASSVDLRMTGIVRTLDFTKLLADMEGRIKPSVTIDMTATMKSDLMFAGTAIKVKTNLYSSSAWSAQLKIRGKEQAVLQVSLPQDRNDILSIRSEMIVLTARRELRQAGIESRYSNSTCTWPFIDQAIGLKMCANYSMPNVTSSGDIVVPSLILSGPINFDVSLEKADLTAKMFVLKYSWIERQNNTIVSVLFETPNSQIPRVFRANITHDAQRKTASMSFVNGNISHKAVGIYINNPNQLRMEMSLNVNDRKYLALEMGYNKTDTRNGRMYYPLFYLSVNNERIAGMNGQVRQTAKNNVTQWDYTIIFETKRVRAKTIGYVSISYDATYMIHNSMEYQFSSSNKVEHVVVNALAEAIKKDLMMYRGNFDLRSSAYPKFDVALNATLVQGIGRFDFTLFHNNAPDLRDKAYGTVIKIIFANDNPYRSQQIYAANNQQQLENPIERTVVSFEVNSTQSKTEMKAMIVHENMLKKGIDHTVRMLLRYAPKRDIEAVVSVSIPRSQLFWFDGRFNLTVPNFHPCTVALKLTEKSRNEHHFDLKGVWFSMHALNVSGWYKDRSSNVKTYHHAKLAAQIGPSYREAFGELKYIQDEHDNSLTLNAIYDRKPYKIFLQHTQQAENGTKSYAHLQWKDEYYWVSALLKSLPVKELNVELHIDKVRDISVSLRGYSHALKREIGVELKWDANRDPTQRFALSGELNTPRDRLYDGIFLLSYPNRTFSGTFDSMLTDDRYLANARVSWNSSEAIVMRLDVSEDKQYFLKKSLLFELNSTFEDWPQNVLKGAFFYNDGLLSTNLTATWAKDRQVQLDLLGQYISNDSLFLCELDTALSSTIQPVPTAKLHLKHSYTAKRFETICLVKHKPSDQPPQVLSVHSNWQYEVDKHYNNITGSLKLVSPFNSYRTGALVTKISFNENRAITGAAEVQLDDDQYEMVVEGHVRNLVDCMLTTNITSSNVNYRNINGRFGVSEKNRHLVAEVITPKTALGIELLYAVVSTQNFDVKFHLATPLKDLEKVILRGKLQSDNIDFRAGMNNMVLGCTGVWRKLHLKDFEYSYRIYTPLQNFEESALIAKLVIDSKRPEYVDVELSGKFSEYKLGLKAISKPKPNLILQLLSQTASSMVEDSQWTDEVAIEVEEEDDEYEDEEEEEQNLLNFIGDIELYTIVLPTIVGTLELTEQKSRYRAIGKLKLPQGDIDIRNWFYLKDFLNMQNSLRLKTPFPVANVITSEFILKYSYVATDVTVGMNVKFNNRSEWVNTGFRVNYKYSLDEAEVHKHQALVDLMTPMKNLQKVFLNGSLDLEDHSYKGNLTAKTMTTDASLALSFESEDEFIDTFMSIWVRAPLMPYYACRVFYKQDFSNTENLMDLGFMVNDGDLYSNFRMDGSWSFAKPHYIKGVGKYQSNFLPINMINTDFLITRSPLPKAYCNVKYHDKNGVIEEIRAKAERNREMFTIDLSVPMEDYKNLSIHGRLQHRQGSEYTVSGQLYRNEYVFQLEGDATITEDIPYRAELVFQPLSAEGSIGSIRYGCRKDSAITAFNLELESGAKLAKLDGSFKLSAMSDWFMKLGLESSEPSLKNVDFNIGINPEADGKALGNFKLHSPWVEYGIDRADIEMIFDVQPISGSVVARYGIRDVLGNASCLWNWALKSNMQFALENRVLRNSIERYFRTGVRYVSPDLENNHNFTFGGDLNLNNIWIANASVDFISIRDVSAVMKVLLPKPVGDVHTLAFAMNGDLPFMEPVKTFNFETSYETDESRKRYAYHTEYSALGDLRALVRCDWGPDIRKERIQSILNIFRVGDRRELMARLRGPWYLEDAFLAHGTFNIVDLLYLFSGNISIPASTKVASANVAFTNLSNMKGDFNCTTPFLNVSWIHGQLEFIENPIESIRYLKGTWPESSAIFDAKATYRNNNNAREQQGTIKIEVPLQTRHFAEVKYGLAQRPLITNGHAEIDYNSEKVLSGQYTSKEESRAGFDKETIDVTLRNKYMPVGVLYVHSLSTLDPVVRSLDIKRAEIFQLDNKTNFNITGELHVLSKDMGQEYLVKAIHSNRTVVLTADFEEENNVSKKKSKLQLSPTVWIAYDFKLTNRSRDDLASQNFTLQISYPKRNISADGWYSYTKRAFDSDVTFSYSPNRTENTEDDSELLKPRTVRGGIEWRDLVNSTTNGQHIRVSLGHPSFQQDVTLNAHYFTDPKHWFSSIMELRYNDDDEHLMRMGFDLNDLKPVVGYWNYSYHLFSNHDASDLDLDSIGSVGVRQGLYGVSSNSHYKRAYLSQMQGHVLGWINMQQKEMVYERMTSQSKYRLWTKADGAYPVYMINGTLLDGPEVDAVGYFYLNVDDKLVQMKINVTPDGSENVHMYGIIPDSRSAYFDFWRDYDNAREVDVTYYLKMNHSRLITGHLLWRPQIKSDVQNWIKDYVNRMHHGLLEYAEFWIKHIYLETKDTTAGICEAAMPYVEGLLEDVAGLSVLQGDLEDLEKFLNASYAADDFYIRSAINFTITVLDELAIRNKITSLPKILTELWHVMGESGQAFGKSITWLLERVKITYQKFIDIVGKIFQGDALRYFSSSLENSLERYDKFVKDIHLQFIKNIQEIWEKSVSMASTFWHKMLQNIEPTIIRLAHYGESLGWYVGNEIFTFLYNKTQEIADSPYFNTVTNFTQDLDNLYKDLVTNDMFTNLEKYSSITRRFLWEKYFQLVPFARELYQVVEGLKEEIKELRKIEYVEFFLQRYDETQAKVEWLAEEFQVKRRLHQLWLILRKKLTHIAQTALQTENHYREAKTKFIFDPDNGILELEQKLPMSWHAFNETPKFEEIPEFKYISDVQDLFAGSNMTVWTLWHQICPFVKPQMWLPPFKSVGLLIGSRHYMSFDKRFVSLELNDSNKCRYLLVHDYYNRSLTVLLEPSLQNYEQPSRQITLVTDEDTIAIDVFNMSVKINNKEATALPALIGSETEVFQESDLLYVQSQRGFLLACSLRYHLCWLELDGWYFGRVAGLLGTMNNEPFDDRITSTNRYSETDEQFLNSWALPGCSAQVTTTNHTSNYYRASNELSQLCDMFFVQKLSYFASCFSVVDAAPFYEMCMDLGNNLQPNRNDNSTDRGACTAALAYIQACMLEDILLRVPDNCISCLLMNGTYVPEGTFVPLRNETVPKAADVVFIIEAKPCNDRFVQTKSINLLVDGIYHELQALNISDILFGVVAFGGSAPFDRAHSIVVGNNVFERHNRLQPFFDHITIGNGTNEDIFDAIIKASKLVFRPGASKTFILLPCSRCFGSRMRLDFSSLAQLLVENDIKLHILADHDLSFQKSRVSRLFYGMDSQLAYTKKDVKQLKGDRELRRQIRLPKQTLGECIALALETDGSIFGGHKLRQDRSNTNNTKKFIKVFAKRIAVSAQPNNCQTCECTGHNTGVAYMQCTPCHYPSPLSMDDEDMTEDMFLSAMQPDDDFLLDDLNW